MPPNIPTQTAADLNQLFAHLTRRAWESLKQFLKALAPWVEPPADMEVRCRDGSQYSGGVVIADNRVMAGAVVRTGQEPVGPSPYHAPPPPRPWSSSESGGSRLAHWASDPRDEDEEPPPWARR